jgi:hypothetical protein
MRTNTPHGWSRKRRTDPQYAAAAIIFDEVPAAWQYCVDGGVHKAELLEASGVWSHGEQILVRVALDLFDPGCVLRCGHTPAHMGEITNVLGSDFFGVFLEAVSVARRGPNAMITSG